MDKATVFQEAETKMDSVVGGVGKDLRKIRTGKASTDLLADIRVNHYGSEMPLNQVATLSTPEPRCILIAPWDQSAVAPIEKAVLESDLGLTPINDGKSVRINIPPLSEERRKELVKIAKNAAEEGRVHVRNVRRDANDHLKKLQKEGEISEDDLRRFEGEIQKMTDQHIAKIDEQLAAKEKETLEM